jgi:maltose alpha-D-glucosyltransferase / alpha-amylase
MRHDWQNNSVVCMHNLGPEPREVCINVTPPDGTPSSLINLLSDNHSEPDGRGQHCILLEPYGYRWYRVGGLDYLLRRTVA